jgi:hypothetical protein
MPYLLLCGEDARQREQPLRAIFKRLRYLVRTTGCRVQPAVQYIPREDVKMSLLERTDRQTYCPNKGECSYFSIIPAGEIAQSTRSGPMNNR